MSSKLDYICQEYRGVESQTSDGSDDDFHGCDGQETQPPPSKKMKSSVLTCSNFTEEDLTYFAQRVSTDMKEDVIQMLKTKDGHVVGVLCKMLEQKHQAMYRKMMSLHSDNKGKFNEIADVCNEMKAKIEKLEGMGKFTYAWCKSAQEAGVYKMKQR